MADEKNEQQAENAEVEKAERRLQAAKAEAELPKAEGRGRGEGREVEEPAKSDGYTPRLKADYDERIVPAMIEKFGYKNRLEVPQARQDRDQHGRRRGDPGQEEGRDRGRRDGADRRPEAGDHQGEEVDRAVQAARRHADRRAR